MPLSTYAGRPAPDAPDGTRIDRVTAHQVWDVHGEATAACANCDERLNLRNRHLLVRLVTPSDADVDDRRHLCDEGCVREWVEGEGVDGTGADDDPESDAPE